MDPALTSLIWLLACSLSIRRIGYPKSERTALQYAIVTFLTVLFWAAWTVLFSW